MNETQIAKENIKKINIILQSGRKQGDTRIKTHKQSCKRFLEFLEDTNKKIINKLILIGELIEENQSEKLKKDFDEMIESDGQNIGTNQKIKDLQDAIFLYDTLKGIKKEGIK